jgi:hypothetical protein
MQQTYAQQHAAIKEYVDKKHDGLKAALSMSDILQQQTWDRFYGLENVTIKALEECIDKLVLQVEDLQHKNKEKSKKKES